MEIGSSIDEEGLRSEGSTSFQLYNNISDKLGHRKAGCMAWVFDFCIAAFYRSYKF